MRAIESTSRKFEASEEKSIWRQSTPEVLTSLEAPHQKQDHQKQFSSEDLKIIRSWKSSEAERIEASKAVQMI